MISENELLSKIQKYAEESNDFFANDSYNQICSTLDLYISQNSGLGKSQCLNLARLLYDDAVRNTKNNGLLTSLVIFDYLNKNVPISPTDFINNNLVAKIELLFDHIKLNINIPDWAPYSDKKCMEKVNAAAQSKNYISIVQELQPFYNGSVFDDCRGSIIIKCLWAIDKRKIIDYLNNNDWTFKMELVLFSLKEDAKDIIQQTLHSNSRYPAVRAMGFFIDLLEKKDFRKETKDEILIYCEMIKDFVYSYCDALNGLKILLGISISKNFNYLAGLCATIYNDFLPKYLPLIKDLSDNAREFFSYGYLRNANEDAIARDSWIIMNYWRDSSISVHDSVNKFNGLEQLLILGLCVGVSSKKQYLMKLKEFASNIIMEQHKWGEHVLQKDLYLMFCLILANKRKKYLFTEEEVLLELPILFDKRYEIKFGNYIFDIMKRLLINPDDVHEIIFKDTVNNKERKFCFLETLNSRQPTM